MKDEIFLRAMGDIDDDLIVAAKQTAPAKHVPRRASTAVNLSIRSKYPISLALDMFSLPVGPLLL